MKETKKLHSGYNLMTAITMIVGICIGSGIFFKADDILAYTGGKVGLGVLLLSIGAFSIIFGSMTLTELSVRTSSLGGLVGFYEVFISKAFANGFGWFQTFVYYPTINVVVAWAAGIYTVMLLGLEMTLEYQILIGTGYLLLMYAMNYGFKQIGGWFQVLTTYVKLLPLLSIAIIGMFQLAPVTTVATSETSVLQSVGFSFLAGLAPVAFSFDGWPIATSISNEVKNPKRNMPIALTIGPLIVLIVYVTYFLGLTKLLGIEHILAVGDQAIYDVGNTIFGAYGGKLILVFVIISVLGVVNGVTLGHIRMPYALATKEMLPNSEAVKIMNDRRQLSPRSFKISLYTSLVWMTIHYLTQKLGLLATGDVSEIAIVFAYICYPILYVYVMKLYMKKEIKSHFKGIIAPMLACIGSGIIILGGIMSNPVYMPVFIVLCGIVFYQGYRFKRE